MTIVVTGGGSGGHITPLLAVAAELKQQQPDTRIIYIGQHGDHFADIATKDPIIDASYTIFAGKFRRYHGEGLKQLLDIKTVLLNLRDLFYIGLGLLQSIRLMGKLRPQVVFTRGGFVSVPVGLAAALRRIPYITHDSDAIPSLANRLIARRAALHAVALPKETYAYPQAKTVTVGVPIAAQYAPVTPAQQTAYRKELGIEDAEQVIFVTGGGLGAKVINDAIVAAAEDLLESYPKLYILHSTGRQQFKEIVQTYAMLPEAEQQRVVAKEYVTDLYRYSGAADIVVARAGATSMAELAGQGKACIIVPNPALAGGHQLKNAEAYERAGAIRVVSEQDMRKDKTALSTTLGDLLESPEIREALGRQLEAFAHPSSAHELAVLLLEQAEKK